MRKPQYDMNIFRQRRQNLAKELQGAALIVAAHPEHIRNHDVEYPYRQDTNLFYLTGFEEPDAIFVFRPGFQPETVMFCRRRDPEMETWNGFRYGPEGVVKEFQIDQAFPIDEFEKVAPQLLHQVEKVYYRLFKNKHFDELVQVALEKTRRIVGRSGYGLLPVFDADTLIGESRLYKSDYEADVLRKACEISADGHIDAMKFTRPGVNERQVQAILAHRFYEWCNS